MAEPTMDEVVNVEEELQPCDFCGRTFLPRPLEKHIRVCQSNATKKRKVFDSQKQRVDGTELASFQLPTYHKKQSAPTSESLNKPSKWKEKHIELVNAIRAARNVNVTVEMSSSTTTLTNPTIATSGGDRCPSCDRQFGPRAFDRHVEWCKERNLRVQKSPADVLLAKERLAARTKYRVPLPTKSKRTIIKEKYSPTLGSRTDSFTSVKSISCATLERAPSTNKSKTAYKKPEITVYDHGDATVVTEETKKTEKPAKDKKTLPEIKPALDPKSPRTSRLLILKQKINTVEVNTTVEGLTVSHLSNSENKGTKRLVTWKDTVNNEAKTISVSSGKKNNAIKISRSFISETISKNDKISVTNLQFDQKPCSVLTSMIEETRKEPTSVRGEGHRLNAQRKLRTKTGKVDDNEDCLLSTKAIKSLLQPKYTRLPVRKLKKDINLTTKAKYFDALVDDDAHCTNLESLSTPDAETDVPSDCCEDSNRSYLSLNDELVENTSKLPVRKLRHSLPAMVQMDQSTSNISIETNEGPESCSKLPVRKLQHRHSLGSRLNNLEKSTSGTSLNDYFHSNEASPVSKHVENPKPTHSLVPDEEELESSSKLPISKLTRLSSKAQSHKSASLETVKSSNLETSGNESKSSRSSLPGNEEIESYSRVLIKKSKKLSYSPKLEPEERVSATCILNKSEVVLNSNSQNKNTSEIDESCSIEKTSRKSHESVTISNKQNFSNTEIADTVKLPEFVEDHPVYTKIYRGGQLSSNDLFQTAKKICEAEKYSGDCCTQNSIDKPYHDENTDSTLQETFDEKIIDNLTIETSNDNFGDEDTASEPKTDRYKFDNENIEEFAKRNVDAGLSNSRTTLSTDNTIVLCEFKKSYFDLDSTDCDESSVWNTALSLARVEQTRRNCSSAVHLQTKDNDSDFITYTETDLDKFGSLDWDEEPVCNVDKRNSSTDCVPAKRRKLVDQVPSSTLDVDSDVSINDYDKSKVDEDEINGSLRSNTSEKSESSELLQQLPKPHRKISPRLLALINLINNQQDNPQDKHLVTLSKDDCRKLFELDPSTINEFQYKTKLPKIVVQKPSKTVNARNSIKESPLNLPPISKIPINKASPIKTVKVSTPTLPEIVQKSFVPSKGVYDKKRSVNTIKRSVSIRESVNKPHLKNKQDVEQYFNQQDKKKADRPTHLEGLGIHNPKVEDLFSIDDEMYEEYKKYEELYLKERQLQNQNTEIPLNELADYDDTEFFGTNSTPKSNTDSAYNSLNRSNPKIRSQLNKLNPLEYQKSHVTPEGSASSSSSETNAMSKLKKRISKFCHECGSKYPIETAKFCVECGVKRLSL